MWWWICWFLMLIVVRVAAPYFTISNKTMAAVVLASSLPGIFLHPNPLMRMTVAILGITFSLSLWLFPIEVAFWLMVAISAMTWFMMPQLDEFIRERYLFLSEKEVDRLLKEATKGNYGRRRTAIVKLGRARTKRAVTTLERIAFEDQDWVLRDESVWALGQIGDEASRNTLHKLLSDENKWVRYQAEKSLISLRGS